MCWSVDSRSGKVGRRQDNASQASARLPSRVLILQQTQKHRCYFYGLLDVYVAGELEMKTGVDQNVGVTAWSRLRWLRKIRVSG
jgi:hypothetical protein